MSLADDPTSRIFAFPRNLVLAASAGTGKTHALVGVVVHLLLGATASKKATPPSHIVATTFSRKAAAEMRERLTTELERLALGDPASAYRASIVAATDLGDGALRARARQALARAGETNIGTLHSFAARILREHAIEANVPAAFDMLDEAETRALAERSICAVLAEEADRDPEAVRDLVQVAGGVLEAARQLARAVGRLEEDGRSAEQLVLDDADAAGLDATLEELLVHARALASDERFAVASRAIANAAKNKANPASLVDAVADFCEVKKKPKNETDAARAFFDFRDASLKSGGGTNRECAVRFVQTWLVRDRFAARSSSYRRLVALADERTRRDRMATGALAFSDVLRLTRELLLSRPDVAARIAARIDALLVDEFQDTSRVQRDVVALLWQRSPETRVPGTLPTLEEARGTGLLVVGDRKQSIYGFRGASVAVFAESCVQLAGEAARSALAIDPSAVHVPPAPTADFVALRHNRRAVAPLLSFANAFSAARLAGSALDLDEVRYVPETEDLLVPPEKRATADEGQGRATADVPRVFWLRPPIVRGSSERLGEAFVVAARVARILETGTPTIANGAAPSPRDIAVLSMTNEMLDAVAFALAERHIPYVVAGRGFFSAREVKDVIAFFRLLLAPSDAIALAEVLRGAWCGISDASLLALADGPRGLESLDAVAARLRSPGVAQADRSNVESIVTLVRRLREQIDRASTGDVLALAIAEGRLEETLVQLPRGEQRVANVRKLVEMARAFEGSAHVLAARFADAVEQAAGESEAATFSDEDDAVRLCTVHASKGLAFPIVFLPEIARGGRRPEFPAVLVDAGAGQRGSSLSVRIASNDGSRLRAPAYARACERMKLRERAELHRLAYVGVTRAAHALYFVGHRTPPKSGAADAYDATTVAVLDKLVADDPFRERVGFVVEDVAIERGGERAAAAARHLPIVPDAPVLKWSHASFAVTALGSFAACARRYELAALMGLPERDLPKLAVSGDAPEDDVESLAEAPRVDARSEGTIAHRILEDLPIEAFGADARVEIDRLLDREGLPEGHSSRTLIAEKLSRFLGGSYASRLRAEGAEIAREVPFALDVHDAEGRAIVLRGSIDLLVRWPDGSVDVIDYKRARGPDPEAHAFQLDVYAVAARELHPNAPSLRTGIAFLGGDPSEPRWHGPAADADVRARIAALGNGVLSARWAASFPRAPLATCERIHCGYVALCHPRRQAAAQLALF